MKGQTKLGHRHKNVRFTLIGIASLVVLFFIVSTVAVGSVFHRSFPRVNEPVHTGRLRYTDVHGYDRSIVHFTSGRNKLTGYLYGDGSRKGLVVISHGLGYGASDYLAETLYFVDKGWRVLTYDNTGTYASEGKNTVGPAQSAVDLDAALRFVRSSSDLRNLPIMLNGQSWGAYAAAAALTDNDDVVAVASISGFNSPMGLFDEQMKRMLGPFAVLEYPIGWMYQTVVSGRSAWRSAVQGINNSSAGVMIIHGSADQDISYTGASIIAHRDEITNPDVAYVTRSEPNHNGHKNLYLSDAATEYAAGINAA